MRASVFIWVVIGTSLVLYLAGYQSLAWTQIQGSLGGSTPVASSFFGNLASAFLPGSTIAGIGIALTTLLGIAVVSGLVSGGNTFLPIFVVPLVLIAIVFVNYVILPTSYLLDNNLPSFLKILISVWFNGNMILAILSFVRGGDL